MRTQVIVVIRFSYLAETGFRMARKGLDGARAALYAPERLTRRFRLFETLTLPSLRAQSDPDFTLAVLIGADFPPTFRQHLVSLIAPLRDARIIALPPFNNYKSTKLAIDACVRPDTTHIISLRLDDDDALGCDVVEAQKRIAPMIASAAGADTPAVICFNNGLFLELSEAGNTIYGVIEKLPLGIGMGMIAPVGARPTIFSTDHRQVHTRWNTYTEALTPRFIRTVHRDNDSGAHLTGARIDYKPDELDTILSQHFNLTRDHLQRIKP